MRAKFHQAKCSGLNGDNASQMGR